jgi:hypothetical protein
MERKKFGAGLIALVAGIALSAGSAFAQSGYLQGDPAYGKLIPYYTVDANTATIIGIERVGAGMSAFISVGVAIFDVYGADKYGGIFLCLSAYEFGYVILQDATASGAQVAETLRDDVIIASVEGGLSSSGYVTLAVTGAGSSCQGMIGPNTLMDSEHRIAAWTVVQDIGTGFYATEIPTTTANVAADGAITCPDPLAEQAPMPGDLIACAGLIPMGNTVVARYDTNPYVGSMTSIFVWLNSNADMSMRSDLTTAYMQCEDGEPGHVVDISLPDKVNVLNPATFTAMEQCVVAGQYRGVLRFGMPAHGFLFSHISQVNASYRMNFLGYNLDQNHFIGQ